MGNARVRTLLMEAVWRFLRWQPGWHAAQEMKVKLARGQCHEEEDRGRIGAAAGD